VQVINVLTALVEFSRSSFWFIKTVGHVTIVVSNTAGCCAFVTFNHELRVMSFEYEDRKVRFP
jgi:hypothetical protein